jgi:hypothetical protein
VHDSSGMDAMLPVLPNLVPGGGGGRNTGKATQSLKRRRKQTVKLNSY